MIKHPIKSISEMLQIVRAVGGKVPILLDGGIRRGTDIFKALALGAGAVLVSPRISSCHISVPVAFIICLHFYVFLFFCFGGGAREFIQDRLLICY